MTDHVVHDPNRLRPLRVAIFAIAAAVASVLLLSSVSPANAGSIRKVKSLHDLVDRGMTLTSKSGKLVFSNFKVTIAGGS
jgi:hypothetical protein